jgi:tripartite-type tricarboxylate transporter receptor subunit TctC
MRVGIDWPLGGADLAPTTPTEFGAYVNQEISRWARVIKKANIQPM